MSKISFVYFDVGGVLIKDFSASNKWRQMMSDMGVKEADYPKFDFIYDEHAQRINLDLPIDNLIPILEKEFKLTIPWEHSWLEEFVARFEPNPEINEIVAQVGKKVRVGLLTNMWPGMLDKIKYSKLLPEVNWSSVVDSTVVHLQKPDKEIYEYAEQLAKVPSSEILFIDNTAKHLVEPAMLGWQTYLYSSSDYDQSNRELADFISHNL